MIDGATAQVHAVINLDLLMSQFPQMLSDEINTFPDYQHKMEIDENAHPIAQKLRPVPLARRQGAADEVRVMDSLGIWEPMDKSKWVHNMVTIPKPGGGIRIMTDLSPLNKFVIPNRFPLPDPKDLLKGATVFSKLDLKKAFYHKKLVPENRHLTTTLHIKACDNISTFQ